jgi:hypothetical protein
MAEKKLPPAKAAMKSIYDFPNTVALSDNELPAIKEWKVGEKYTISLEVEQTSMRKKEDGSMCAEFKIISASSEDEEENEEGDGMNKGGKVSKTISPKIKVPVTKVTKETSSKATSTKATPKSDRRKINQYDIV